MNNLILLLLTHTAVLCTGMFIGTILTKNDEKKSQSDNIKLMSSKDIDKEIDKIIEKDSRQ